MKHYEAAELVELGNTTELVLGGFVEPPENANGDSQHNFGCDDDVE